MNWKRFNHLPFQGWRVLALITLFGAGQWLSAESIAIEARVVAVNSEQRSFQVELLRAESDDPAITVGRSLDCRVGPGDLALGYLGRRIQAEAVHYNQAWHLERVFPADAPDFAAEINAQLRRETESMRRGSYVKAGQRIPDFVLIDQQGAFIQAYALAGRPFILNFIFTRCRAATMCPAATTRMAELQDAAREMGLDQLRLVTISFDPEYDSPGILRQYAEGYGIEFEDFHLLTGARQVVDDLLRQFGLLTLEEDGTINHTMATLLVDAEGRVAVRKEGSNWSVQSFLQAVEALQ
ncbi:MAG: protein SCO1/2 [Lentimonas sp.]|jgi:protein SCO1/2